MQLRSPLDALLDVARNMFPDNVAAAAVNMNILGVITFSLFFGLCLSTVGDDAEPMVKLVDVGSLPLLHSCCPCFRKERWMHGLQ